MPQYVRLPSTFVHLYIYCVVKPSDRTEMLLCAIVVPTGGQATGGWDFQAQKRGSWLQDTKRQDLDFLLKL
jgi:hypothetical protein